ncbi:23S rRNA (adenine(2503)-C(2))-methyltransferase RlmN [uncultured Selenomonas sp.]|uniref:23S rRNA (adenine(2503)-C(2))-methyltransferase RlmN n=1 Tax=uncultured Selenomonas sp. TaxID=159275 RepID=UPI0025E5B80E|nr:23S rRNA (adenine(2503)-C(2))-methyltransferase RlmN [uncultured Selenomonas sp.]
MEEKQNLFGLDVAALQERLVPLGVQKFRAKQVAQWMYEKGARSFGAMTNLSKALREELAASFEIATPAAQDVLVSKDGKTEKFLLAFADGTAVESVLMRQPYGNSICISTQAGCAMGCAFCASTLHGRARDLTAAEMLGEVFFIEERLRGEGQHVDTMVLMGSGEPLMNYENVVAFLHLVHDPAILGMSYRSITLSTSGIVPNIYRLADEGLPVSLSISLHAPEDALRSELMPINKKYPMADVIAAGKMYGDKTKRRVTYEYILIDGRNDSSRHADELAKLLRGQLASVNLIPINPVVERHLLRPPQERIDAFERRLAKRGIAVTVRREMGTDINAACGQLRNRHLETQA